MMAHPREELTVQVSPDEQPHVEQSIRASKSPTAAGLAMANAARRVISVIENFILTQVVKLIAWGCR